MKKGSNEGHIRKRTDGRWEARVSLGFDALGKRKRKSVFGNTRQEVRDKLLILNKQLLDGDFSEPTNITLGAWIKNWLDNYMKLKLRQTTWESYETMYRIHVKDAIGPVKLHKLTTSDLQKFYNDLLTKNVFLKSKKDKRKKTLSPRTVRYVNQVVHGAIEQAVKEGIIKNNPTKNCILPKDKKTEMQTLTIEQCKTFLATAKGHRLYASFLLDLTTGLRRGELLGLRWSDIDFNKNTIKLDQQIVCTKTGDKITDLKTDLSKRVIDVPDHVMKQLKTHRLLQKIEKWKLKGSKVKCDLVFVNEMGGPLNPKNYYRLFKSILKSAKLPDIRIHDLRHTYALICMQQGVHIKALQENLGHHSPAFTLETYGHASADMRKEAAEKIGKIIQI